MSTPHPARPTNSLQSHQQTQPPAKRPAQTKPPTHLSPNTTIADTAILTGPTHSITIGANTIIHPRARLVSTYGPVVIGEGCIVCERSCVGLSGGDEEGGMDKDGVRLERGVMVEAGALVEARCVGEGSVIEVGARVGRGVVLGKHCKISPLCTVSPGQVLPDYTVLYGNGQRRIDESGFEAARMKVGERHVEVLKKLVPSHAAKFV